MRSVFSFRHLRKTGTAVLNFDDPIGRKWASEFSQRHSSVNVFRTKEIHTNFYAESFTETEKEFLSRRFVPSIFRQCSLFLDDLMFRDTLSALCSTRAVGVSEKMEEMRYHLFWLFRANAENFLNADFSVLLTLYDSGSLEKMLLSARNMVKDDGSLTLVLDSVEVIKIFKKRRLISWKKQRLYADTIIVTDDEPYVPEKPEVIRQHILKKSTRRSWRSFFRKSSKKFLIEKKQFLKPSLTPKQEMFSLLLVWGTTTHVCQEKNSMEVILK